MSTVRMLNRNNVALPVGGNQNPPWIGSPDNPAGRTYFPIAAGGFLDVTADPSALASQGLFAVGDSSGTTAQRPTGVRVGWLHLDTTLGKIVAFDGTSWRDPVTGGVV
jgi:hypothetical protein